MATEANAAVDGPGRTLEELVPDGHAIAMLMTIVDGRPCSRPLTCLEVRDDDAHFLVSARSEWVEAIANGAASCHLTVADDRANRYLAANGTATITRDEVLRRHLWSPAADVFFDGPDDPDLVVLVFRASDGEYWEGPSSRLGRSMAMLRGAMHHDAGEAGRTGPIV